MKSLSRNIPVIILCFSILFTFPAVQAMAQYNYSMAIPAQNANVQYDLSLLSYNDFYQNLAPYGQWIDDAAYGYAWSPAVEDGFRPYYTNGHWAMTDYGNTWISDYPWGWACFHYGRWTFDSFYGWLWLPGQNWGPAWVCWRDGNGYYGWAPLSPEFSLKSKTDFSCPNDWWIFIPPKYIHSGNYYRYWSGPRNNKDIIHNSAIVNNTYENNHVTFVHGPRKKQVEEVTKQPVQVFKLANSNNLNTKIHDDIIKMYRPAEINPTAMVNGEKATPPNVMKAPRNIPKPQPVTQSSNAAPEFKAILLKNKPVDAVGTHISEPAKTPQQSNDTRPLQWDTK